MIPLVMPEAILLKRRITPLIALIIAGEAIFFHPFVTSLCFNISIFTKAD